MDIEESRQCIEVLKLSVRQNTHRVVSFSTAVLVLQATFLYLKYRHVIILSVQLFSVFFLSKFLY